MGHSLDARDYFSRKAGYFPDGSALSFVRNSKNLASNPLLALKQPPGEGAE